MKKHTHKGKPVVVESTSDFRARLARNARAAEGRPVEIVGAAHAHPSLVRPRYRGGPVGGLSVRERDTILAALRYWQADLDDETLNRDIAAEHGDPLSAEDIDELCERINA